MHKSPLIIDFYFVKKVHFELKDGFDSDPHREMENIEPANLDVKVESGKSSDEPAKWRFELSIESGSNSLDTDFPYIFSIILVGFFRVDENYPAEKADLLAQVNAPSVLYSAAREFLANVTGRSPYTAILLPSISFIPEPEETKKKKKSVKKTTAKKKTPKKDTSKKDTKKK